MTKIYLGGRLVEAQEACIHAGSRAARFGDGVFETVPVHGGRPYLWRYHIERLNAGLSALRIPPVADLHDNILDLIKKNSIDAGMVRIAVSRDGASRGYLPSPYPSTLPPMVMIETLPCPQAPAAVALWRSSYEKISPRALPVECKLAQGVNSTLARMEAADNACEEALQLDSGGNLCEASSANIFWRRDHALYTPSLGSGALAGVTRRRLMELSPLPVREGIYPLGDVRKADAVILTNAAYGILPVKSLLPQGWTWESHALAQELNALRKADMER